jgi:hypothetical protein
MSFDRRVETYVFGVCIYHVSADLSRYLRLDAVIVACIPEMRIQHTHVRGLHEVFVAFATRFVHTKHDLRPCV